MRAAVDDDDIPILRRFAENVADLRYDEVFAIIQRRVHRLPRYLRRDEEENMNDHSDEKRHDDGINLVKKFVHECMSPYI